MNIQDLKEKIDLISASDIIVPDYIIEKFRQEYIDTLEYSKKIRKQLSHFAIAVIYYWRYEVTKIEHVVKMHEIEKNTPSDKNYPEIYYSYKQDLERVTVEALKYGKFFNEHFVDIRFMIDTKKYPAVPDNLDEVAKIQCTSDICVDMCDEAISIFIEYFNKSVKLIEDRSKFEILLNKKKKDDPSIIFEYKKLKLEIEKLSDETYMFKSFNAIHFEHIEKWNIPSEY
jgi:hypothetical protein